MITVRPFEADLLRVLHAILGRGPMDRAVNVVQATRPRPKCLSRDAVNLIEDTLAKGCVRMLASPSSWQRERFIRGERVVEGRLWERNTPESMGLTFSNESLEFLIWLVADNIGATSPKRGPVDEELTPGDSLLFYFTYEAFSGTKVAEILRKTQFYRSHDLCRLAFPVDFADVPEPGKPDLARWLEPNRAWILEALQESLAEAWLASERQKRTVTDPARMVAIGGEQARVFDAFLSGIDASGRRDLARFYLMVARELLWQGSGLDTWKGALDWKGMRLADRADATRASLATLSILERFEGWEREARSVGYFDEGYAAAQLWKSDWERFGGEELRALARALFRAADPLASAN